MIELEQVTKRYGRKVAVRDLSLSIPAGELFAFLGPNGAGKTTTIKMLVGLLRPTAGVVRLCGIDLARDPREASRRLGYVPDQPYLYDKLSGREFLEFIVDMYGLPSALGEERIASQIEQFDLADFVDHLTESYSHGMKQRLVFASVMLRDPAVLVIDEPMVGLDPRSAKLVKDLLRRRATLGTTVFMSTHTLSVAEEIAERIGIIDHGRLRMVGTLDELRHQSSLETTLEELFLRITSQGDDEPLEPAALPRPEGP